MSQKTNLKAIADAIRAKEGSTAPIPANTFAQRIAAIQTGVELPELTNPGTAADLLAGKQLIDADGNLVLGSIPQRAASTIMPGTADQTILSGRYLTGAQTIKGDANLLAANIKSGVSIFGVSGTLASGWYAVVFPETLTKTSSSSVVTVTGDLYYGSFSQGIPSVDEAVIYGGGYDETTGYVFRANGDYIALATSYMASSAVALSWSGLSYSPTSGVVTLTFSRSGSSTYAFKALMGYIVIAPKISQ